jgi:hypothetical protein
MRGLTVLLALIALVSNASAITIDFNPDGTTVTASSSAASGVTDNLPANQIDLIRITLPVTLTMQLTSMVGAPEDWQNFSFEFAYQQALFFCTIHRTDLGSRSRP